jgi:hypothetical protein
MQPIEVFPPTNCFLSLDSSRQMRTRTPESAVFELIDKGVTSLTHVSNSNLSCAISGGKEVMNLKIRQQVTMLATLVLLFDREKKSSELSRILTDQKLWHNALIGGHENGFPGVVERIERSNPSRKKTDLDLAAPETFGPSLLPVGGKTTAEPAHEGERPRHTYHRNSLP